MRRVDNMLFSININYAIQIGIGYSGIIDSETSGHKDSAFMIENQ